MYSLVSVLYAAYRQGSWGCSCGPLLFPVRWDVLPSSGSSHVRQTTPSWCAPLCSIYLQLNFQLESFKKQLTVLMVHVWIRLLLRPKCVRDVMTESVSVWNSCSINSLPWRLVMMTSSSPIRLAPSNPPVCNSSPHWVADVAKYWQFGCSKHSTAQVTSVGELTVTSFRASPDTCDNSSTSICSNTWLLMLNDVVSTLSLNNVNIKQTVCNRADDIFS